jgi:citrate synthase
MGFGHRVYKVRDPRADVLGEAAKKFYLHGGDAEFYDLVLYVEKVALALLEEYKPGHNLKTNVEFYTALLLHGLALPTVLFTPTFAIARAAGWIAHANEQRADRLLRPAAQYIGVKNRKWLPIEERT